MILEKLAASTRIRVEAAKENMPLEIIKDFAHHLESHTPFSFEKALMNSDINFICEVKKASPSKGLIAEDFPYLDIAREYQDAGASAVSVLTEPEYFKGSNLYLHQIAKEISIPVIRKDFTIDPYQIYEAKVLGASAVLLICALLDTDKIKKFLEICDKLELSALVEAHNEEEVKSALDSGARLIGVNNRNLKTFEVDFNHCLRLRSMVPSSIPFVAESGIKTPEDIKLLRDANVNAVLIGETLMRSPDKKSELMKLRGDKR